MEGLGVWKGSEFSNPEPQIWQKSLFLRNCRDFPANFRPLKNIFRTLENGHSIRHQSITPLSAGRLAHFLHDGAMLLAICRATPYCHANVAQLRSSLSKTRGGVASLEAWCLSIPCQGNRAVTDPRATPTPFPPIKSSPNMSIPLWTKVHHIAASQSQCCLHRGLHSGPKKP